MLVLAQQRSASDRKQQCDAISTIAQRGTFQRMLECPTKMRDKPKPEPELVASDRVRVGRELHERAHLLGFADRRALEIALQAPMPGARAAADENCARLGQLEGVED